MADDDAAKARMMADLGLSRRDQVSAPVEPGNRGPRVDPREQQRAVDAHRARTEAAAAAGGGNGNQANSIAAWNNPSNFEQDEVTNQLENRFSGQGHRAALTRTQAGPSGRYDDRTERAENRYGEERSMYLQAHGRAIPGIGHHSANRRPAVSKQDKFADLIGRPRDSRARMMADESPRGRGRPQVSRPQNPNAAPAPTGKTLFRHDQVVHQSGPTQHPSAPAPPTHAFASISHSHPVQPNGTAPDPSQGPILYNPQAAAAVRSGSPSAQSRTSTSTHGTSKSRRKDKGFDGFKNMQNLDGFKALKTTTPNTRPALENPAYQGVYFMRALKYAANPGVECDVYHEKFPERKPLLEMAVAQIFVEIIKLLKNGDERDLAIYTETHKDRDWMVQGAKQAKEIVENHTPDEIEDFCEENPSPAELVTLATQYIQAKPRQDSVIAVKRQDSVVAMEIDSAETPAPPVEEALQTREVPDAVMANVDDNIQTSPPLGSTVIAATPEPITSPPHVRKRKAAAAAPSGQANLSSPSSAKTEHKSAKIDLEDNTPAATKNAQPASFEVLPEASSSSPVAETTTNRAPLARYAVVQEASSSSPLPESKTNRAARASESTGTNSSSATKVEPDTAAPEADKKGMLTAIFYDSASQLVDMVQHAIVAPVLATITLASKEPAYDPTQLINEIDGLAKSMVERTTNTSKGINGTSLVAYDSDEEL